MGRLKGKVALVTGAARGHAESLAKRFADEGASLAICDIASGAELESSVGAEIRATGARVLCFQTDVADEQQVDAMVQKTFDELGPVDILANVVGIAGPTKDLWQMSLAEWRQTLSVNLDSMFLCSKAVLPEMIRRRSGRIINFSSPTGKQPLAHRSPYATSKMAVIGLTRTLAAEVGRYNITVNAICPGGHPARSRELQQALSEYLGQEFNDDDYRPYGSALKQEGEVLAGRWLAGEGYKQYHGTSDDAAKLAVFLASEEAESITGQDINASGGDVMW